MKTSVGSKLLIVVMVALFANAPIASACVVPGCQLGGPYVCNQYIPNPELVHDCGWNVTTTAGYVDLNGLTKQLYTSYIDIPATEAGDMEIYAEIAITTTSPGTETLRVELVQGTGYTHIARVDPVSPYYREMHIPINDSFKGQSFRVRFRYVPGIAPGGTTFRVEKAYLFAVTS